MSTQEKIMQHMLLYILHMLSNLFLCVQYMQMYVQLNIGVQDQHGNNIILLYLLFLQPCKKKLICLCDARKFAFKIKKKKVIGILFIITICDKITIYKKLAFCF